MCHDVPDIYGFGIIIVENAVFRISIRWDPIHFGHPDPDLFHETDPGRKKEKLKSWKMSTKINPNHKNILYIYFFLILNFCLIDINIYLIINK